MSSPLLSLLVACDMREENFLRILTRQDWFIWDSGTEQGLRAIFFLDEQHGWAAGPGIVNHTEDGNSVLWSTDEGDLNRTKKEVFDKAVTDIFMQSEDKGWLLGFAGLLLHDERF